MSIIGLLLIIVSLIYINKILKNEKNIYEKTLSIYDDIKYYHDLTENIVSDFNDLIENSLNKTEKIQDSYLKNDNKEEKTDIINSNKILIQETSHNEIDNNTTNEVYNQILELKKLGLSSKEIAKKLNKGVREVEIIIKMIENI